jgi:hypothetical protein
MCELPPRRKIQAQKAGHDLEEPMNDELLAQIEREVLGWDGVFKKRDEDGPGGIGVTGYRYGDPQTGGPQIGHVHDDGHADFRFPREVRDELIRTGRAIPHPAFPDSRTTASYRIQNAEDVADVLTLFRMNYERRKEQAERNVVSRR